MEGVIFMLEIVHLKKDILRRLENMSNEKGISPDILANDLLDKALPEENEKNMINLADKFNMLVDTGEFDEPTNTVELRDQIRERKI